MNRANYIVYQSNVYSGSRQNDEPRIVSRKLSCGCTEIINIITCEKTMIYPSEEHERAHKSMSKYGHFS
jgi:hypothetical protein